MNVLILAFMLDVGIARTICLQAVVSAPERSLNRPNTNAFVSMTTRIICYVREAFDGHMRMNSLAFRIQYSRIQIQAIWERNGVILNP